MQRFAPATLRNREPIAEVLREWLPASGLVLEIASGTGEHAMHFARHFPALEWQPSDRDEENLGSIRAWRDEAELPNILDPILLDAAQVDWAVDAVDAADAILCINMAHISPWKASLGVLDGAAKTLKTGGALILYGPWIQAGVETAESNLAFDRSLKERDSEWGLRRVQDFEAEAVKGGFVLEQVRAMPANNLMLLFRFAR